MQGCSAVIAALQTVTVLPLWVMPLPHTQLWQTCPRVTSTPKYSAAFWCCSLQAPLDAQGLVVGGAASSCVSGPKVFTDIAFEAASSGLQLATQHMYVATAAGAVFQVDYGRCGQD